MKTEKKYSPISRRANEQCKEAVASIVLYEVSNPTLRMITITGCDVSPDKRNAKVFYTAQRNRYKQVEEALNKAKGYIRKLLGQRLNWRVVPDLKFYLDPSVDMGETIAKAFEKEGLSVEK